MKRNTGENRDKINELKGLKKYQNLDVGKQCATCKDGSCSCIHKIIITAENQPKLEWAQNGHPQRITLLDKGKGSKINLYLKSKTEGITCSHGLGKECPQFFISKYHATRKFLGILQRAKYTWIHI